MSKSEHYFLLTPLYPEGERCKHFATTSLAVWPLESLIPLKEEDKPSNILPGGIFWFEW